MRRWLVAGAVAGLLTAGIVLIGRSSLLRVRTVDVTGGNRQGVAAISAAAAVPAGAPMWTLDVAAVRRRVAALPRVRTVTVIRNWPTTVLIKITERQPVAVVTVPAGAPVVVDSAAAEIERVPAPPVGLLPIALTATGLADTQQARRPLVTAALAVAAALPAQIRSRVALVRLSSGEQVELVFADGTVIRWGSAAESERKAAVLTALLRTPYQMYDVRAPESPAVR